ncbi:MAG: hypothetical protein IT323_10305 [Anaerolineae bacterium]|nr:hypothetical protein [Anaerolineae bacterium]
MPKSRHIVFYGVIVALLAALWGSASGVGTVGAQDSGERPHAIARVYEGPLSSESYFTIFGPDGSNPGKLMANPDQQGELSGDGRWIVSAGFDPARNAETLEYRPVNGRPTAIPVDAGFSVLNAHFSPDARMLFYTLASLEPRQWILGLFDPETGRKIEFVGSSGDDSVLGPGLVANAISLVGERMILSAYLPFAGGNFGGIYAINLTGLAAAAPGRYPLPTSVEQLLPAGPFILASLSPDGQWLAFLAFNEANPPQNYSSFGPAATFNALGALNLTTGEVRTLAQAGPGQGLEALTWTPDGANVLFTGGSYGGSYYIVTPNLYGVDIATATVVERGQLTSNPAEVITDILACGETLYSVANVDLAEGGRTADLYAAPLDNPTARTSLVSGSTIFLPGCGALITP